MNKSIPKIIAISSLPTVGNAGLKNLLAVLGIHTLPVPTLLLSGLGNMPGFQRLSVPFEELLHATFQMAQQQDYSLVVYTGYFANAEQVDIVREAIQRYRDHIHALVVDPICGDQGRAYVDQTIIDHLPDLLSMADWALPNVTELQLLLNQSTTDLNQTEPAFRQKFSELNYIITGLVEDNQISNRIHTSQTDAITTHTYTGQPQSGTGDTFAAWFLYYYYLKQVSAIKAGQLAGEQVASQLLSELQPNGQITNPTL
ncbi:MAG: bifunctional hydroxymethylpyrimidine kinase/phosphomethylpyrimidine kinase [Bacteroidota bacterium]